MLWVGGSIILHGLEVLGWPWAYHHIHDLAVAAGQALPQAQGFVEWAVTAAIDGAFGVLLGVALIPLATRVIGPLIETLTGKKKAAH
jgi:predicted DNA repair protein MutK